MPKFTLVQFIISDDSDTVFWGQTTWKLCQPLMILKFNFFNLNNGIFNIKLAFLHTGAALCITHAFDSAHPQTYVIAHKLLICRFNVNFLHKNPIIGQI